MHAPRPAHAARLQSLQQQARIDAGRDVDFVHAWQPSDAAGQPSSDWLFVAKQVLTVAELSTAVKSACKAWRPPGS